MIAFPVHRLADRIIDAILTGTLTPGTRLDEGELARQSGLPAATVHATLAEICARGFARRHDDGGAEVLQPDLAILLEWFEALGEIQALCALLAARRAPAGDVLLLEELVVRMQDAEPATYHTMAGDLHDRICRMSKNLELVRIAGDLRARLTAACHAVPPASSSLREWWLEEHRALLDAIANRNETLAATIMRGHLRAMARDVVFAAGGVDPPIDGMVS